MREDLGLATLGGSSAVTCPWGHRGAALSLRPGRPDLHAARRAEGRGSPLRTQVCGHGAPQRGGGSGSTRSGREGRAAPAGAAGSSCQGPAVRTSPQLRSRDLPAELERAVTAQREDRTWPWRVPPIGARGGCFREHRAGLPPRALAADTQVGHSGRGCGGRPAGRRPGRPGGASSEAGSSDLTRRQARQTQGASGRPSHPGVPPSTAHRAGLSSLPRATFAGGRGERLHGRQRGNFQTRSESSPSAS